ncbi:MAG: hypothetical protein ACI9IA_000335 [Enterobacterales bacterium]|jgi:hypothetical protein
MVSPDLIIIKRWTSKQFTVLAVTILLILLGFSLSGYLWGVADAIKLNSENETLLKQLNGLQSDQDATQRQLVMQKQISKVDQAANYHAGNSMDIQLQKIRDLERELTFFRSIMAPEESIKGLQISRFSWQKSDTGDFNWQLSLIQAGAQGRALSGFVKLDLVATKDGKEVIIPIINLEQETNKQQRDRYNYRFKYFQHLTGTLNIADGLVPLSIKVVAKPAINGQQSIEKQFPWQADEEKLANVE